MPKLNRALVNELATGRYLSEHAPALTVALCGTGKSYITQALGHCAVHQGANLLFTTYAQLTASLAPIAPLIIDDFGLKPLRPSPDEDLRDLITERHEAASTIVTSNLDFAE